MLLFSVSKLSISQAPYGLLLIWRGFATFLAYSNCLKTVKLHCMQANRVIYSIVFQVIVLELMQGCYDSIKYNVYTICINVNIFIDTFTKE